MGPSDILSYSHGSNYEWGFPLSPHDHEEKRIASGILVTIRRSLGGHIDIKWAQMGLIVFCMDTRCYDHPSALFGCVGHQVHGGVPSSARHYHDRA